MIIFKGQAPFSLQDIRYLNRPCVSAIPPPGLLNQLDPQRQHHFCSTAGCSINHLLFLTLHRVTLVPHPALGPKLLSSLSILDSTTQARMKSTHLIFLVCQTIKVLRPALLATLRSLLTVWPLSGLLSSSSVTLVHPIPAHIPHRSPTILKLLPSWVLPRLQSSFGRLAPLPCLTSNIWIPCEICVRINLSPELFLQLTPFSRTLHP